MRITNIRRLTTWNMTTLQRLAAWDSNFGNLGYNYPVNQTFFSGSLSTIPELAWYIAQTAM